MGNAPLGIQIFRTGKAGGNGMALKTDDFDHALPFLFFTTLGVIGMIAVLCWGAAKLHVNGLTGLLKGGWA